jgi:hypothetical protein
MAAPRPRTPRPRLALANSVEGHSRTLAHARPAIAWDIASWRVGFDHPVRLPTRALKAERTS